MSEVIFIEGISGVGKSTMVQSLAHALYLSGKTVKSYLEFDFTNPIDFYCTAYFYNEEYDQICTRYKEKRAVIERYSIPTGKATLVRYYNQNTPLFSEPLLSEMVRSEFCYHPTRLVPLTEYTEAYEFVWKSFALSLDQKVDYYIFDGSLLHHPINDMLQNYNADITQAGTHVKAMLDTICFVKRYVFYLYTDDISEQLIYARKKRGQKMPTQGEIAFWEKRRSYDQHILDSYVGEYNAYHVSKIRWNCVMRKIMHSL